MDDAERCVGCGSTDCPHLVRILAATAADQIIARELPKGMAAPLDTEILTGETPGVGR